MPTTAEAKEFVRRWKAILAAVPEGKNNEQQDTAKFWQDLLVNVLGVPSNSIATFVDFERKVRGRRIDVFVSDHHFLCEQKSAGVDLDKPEPRQGRMETPYQQATWYAQHLPYSERPRWLMTCNFETFRLYDLDEERPEDGMQEFTLDELPDCIHMLSFLTSKEASRLHKEQQLSIEAGGYVSKLYDALSKQYHHIDGTDEAAREEQRSLNVLITRIIFMLYAEDADLLQSHTAFGDFCKRDPHKLRGRLMELFRVIDTPLDERDEYMDEELAAFPYVNGGLFSDGSIIIPQMTAEIAQAVVDASEGFMWRDISGVIFGGVFEGTLNPETRHAGGMHYTSVENIERCLKPLFLDELWDELHRAEGERSNAKRRQMLDALHDKIASITIGDPACGSGNFLTEAYRQLRTIENRIIEDENGDQTALVIGNPIRLCHRSRKDGSLDYRGADAPQDTGNSADLRLRFPTAAQPLQPSRGECAHHRLVRGVPEQSNLPCGQPAVPRRAQPDQGAKSGVAGCLRRRQERGQHRLLRRMVHEGGALYAGETDPLRARIDQFHLSGRAGREPLETAVRPEYPYRFRPHNVPLG